MGQTLGPDAHGPHGRKGPWPKSPRAHGPKGPWVGSKDPWVHGPKPWAHGPMAKNQNKIMRIVSIRDFTALHGLIFDENEAYRFQKVF